MIAAKSNPLQRLVRRYISPPFLVLRYEITGRAGMIQSGECSLLSGVDDRDAADREARDYLNRTAMISGECRYTIILQPWWLRIRIPPNMKVTGAAPTKGSESDNG